VPESASSETAALLAALRAELTCRDLDVYAVWKRILRAVEELPVASMGIYRDAVLIPSLVSATGWRRQRIIATAGAPP
jgi:hypothetical protein